MNLIIALYLERNKISGYTVRDLDSNRLPMKMEPIERSETSASNTQTPGNYPKETVLQQATSYRQIRRHTYNLNYTVGPRKIILPFNLL
jgi:hypothetical protein